MYFYHNYFFSTETTRLNCRHLTETFLHAFSIFRLNDYFAEVVFALVTTWRSWNNNYTIFVCSLLCLHGQFIHYLCLSGCSPIGKSFSFMKGEALVYTRAVQKMCWKEFYFYFGMASLWDMLMVSMTTLKMQIYCCVICKKKCIFTYLWKNKNVFVLIFLISLWLSWKIIDFCYAPK